MWKHSSEASSLVKLARSMQAFAKPITRIKLKCQSIVMEMNHTVDMFNSSKKSQSNFLKLDQSFDRKLQSMAAVRNELSDLELKAASIEGRLSLVDIPFSEYDANSVRNEVVSGIGTLRATLDEFASKLDDVEAQIEEIREEARIEIVY